MENNQIRVIIADDQTYTRRALKALLAFEPRIAIVGEASNGKDAVRLVGERQPDLLLIDIHMPGINGLNATRQIKSSWPDVKVIIYTMFPNYEKEAYQAGANYFLVKGIPGVSPTQIILSLFPIEEVNHSRAGESGNKDIS